MILGVLFIIVSTPIVLFTAYGVFRTLPDAIEYLKPTSWIIDELRTSQGGAFTRRGALEVLGQRVADEKLTPEQWNALLNAIGPALASRTSYQNPLSDAITSALTRHASPGGADPTAFAAVLSELEGKPSADFQTLEDALASLFKRNDLPVAERDRLTNLVIMRQTSRQAPSLGRAGWSTTALAHAFHRQAATGRVPIDQLSRYFDATMAPKLIINDGKPVIAGTTVRVTLDLFLPASVIGTRFAYRIHPRGACANWPVAGQDIDPAVMQHDSLSGCAPTWWTTVPEQPGDYVIESDLEILVYELEEHGSAGVVASEYADPTRLGDLNSPRLRVTKSCSETLRVLTSLGKEAIGTVMEPEPSRVVRDRGKFTGVFGWKCSVADLVDVRFTSLLVPPPVTVASDVFVRQGDVERRIGWILVPAGAPWKAGVSAAGTGLKAGACEIILRPNPGILRDANGFGPIYGQEIRIEGGLWSPSAKDWEGAYYDWPE